mmetsp:Transcript_45457/g.120922  ORF Transcript_45457/g.120922 Transcript_45457/m.120922 type:complete len:191 (-) Transcript_45457:314-886(-)
MNCKKFTIIRQRHISPKCATLANPCEKMHHSRKMASAEPMPTFEDLSGDDVQDVRSGGLCGSELGVSSPGRVVIECAMEKRGFWNTAWKTRIFVLDNRGRIFYYRSREDRDAGNIAGKIALTRECTVSFEETREGRGYVDIHVPANGKMVDRTFRLSSSYAAICRAWALAVEMEKGRLHYGCFPGDSNWW